MANFPIKLLEASYDNCTSCEFDRSDPIKLHLRWMNLKDNINYGFRFEVRHSSGIAAGTSVVYSGLTGKMGELSEAMFTYRLDNLIPGEYTTYYTFFAINDVGQSSIDMDCVPGLNFVIRPTENDIQWNMSAWGAVVLPTPVVEVMR